jgi:hypothetical protein
MTNEKFIGDGTGYTIIRKKPEEPAHEKTDTQGMIIHNSEETK